MEQFNSDSPDEVNSFIRSSTHLTIVGKVLNVFPRSYEHPYVTVGMQLICHSQFMWANVFFADDENVIKGLKYAITLEEYHINRHKDGYLRLYGRGLYIHRLEPIPPSNDEIISIKLS